MALFPPAQNPASNKGFGQNFGQNFGMGFRPGFVGGMLAVLAAYGALFAWAQMHGPDVRAAREERMVSRTVIIDRVLPMNAELLAQPPITEAEALHGGTKESVTETPAAVTPAEVTPAPHPPIKADVESVVDTPAVKTVDTNPTDTKTAEIKPPVAEDPQLKGVAQLPNGMYIAPVDGIYEDVAQGRLPVRRADGLSAYKAYKKPIALAGNKPVISIAVQDMGLSAQLTQNVIKNLPPEVTLILSPYAPALDSWVKDAREGGHEVWLSLPMESQNYPRVDTGPHSLLVGAPERENLQKLEWVMSRTTGYVGLIAPYQDIFIATQNDARPMLGNIYKRGLGFIDGRGKGSLGETMAASMNAPYSNINVWIDKPDNTADTINAALKQLETIAREGGFAAGVVSANDASLREVGEWLRTLKDKGFVLAPLSAQTGM